MKKTRALFLFSYDNPARQIARDTCTSPWFDSTILLVIVGNALMMAVDDPLDDSRDACPRDPCPDDTRTALELLCNLIFTAELLLKIFSFGFVIGEGTYLRSGWNMLDFIIGAPLCRLKSPEQNSLRSLCVRRYSGHCLAPVPALEPRRDQRPARPSCTAPTANDLALSWPEVRHSIQSPVSAFVG